MISTSDKKNRIVRVLTYGKDLEAVETETVAAVQSGNQVLVNAACASDSIHPKPDGGKVAVAAWAEALCQAHGFGWRRVGLDVLFLKPAL